MQQSELIKLKHILNSLPKKIISRKTLYFFLNFKSITYLIKKYILSSKIIFTHKYQKYTDYLNFQKEKTLDPERINKWLNEEWKIKYSGFKDIFNRNYPYISDKSNAICLGSRTGQEVKALIDIGINAIGIDLVPFEPYTKKGDIHFLEASDTKYDFIFTNIFDHSLYPEKFCSEMERICQKNGIIMIHLQLGIRGDKYTENFINDPNYIGKFFKHSIILESREIRNTFDGMNWELILKKKQN